MSERPEEVAAYARKVRRAAQLLLVQRHRKPGVKGWELRKHLGKNFMEIIDLLSIELEKLGLQVKILPEAEEYEPERLSNDQLDKARFIVTLKEPIGSVEMMAGWRIDDVAMLAATVAYIISRHGKAPRKEVEKILAEKFPKWRIEMNLERFMRRGYLAEEGGILHLDWRARAEIDQKMLLSLIIGREIEKSEEE